MEEFHAIFQNGQSAVCLDLKIFVVLLQVEAEMFSKYGNWNMETRGTENAFTEYVCIFEDEKSRLELILLTVSTNEAISDKCNKK